MNIKVTRRRFETNRSPRNPDEVVLDDAAEAGTPEGANTPAGEPEDEFFSSWDKPTIKRPSNPPSRSGTPPVASRTASPFLKPGVGEVRSKSPLSAAASSSDSKSSTAAASRTITSSAAIRKSAATGAAKKSSILGAKKKGLGAKKVTADSGLDFEEAEKKAREEAERIEKLGYDPDEETPETTGLKSPNASSSDTANIISPTPLSPGRAGGFGATQGRDGNSGDVERLGMGVTRLGFGQVGAAAKAAAAPKKAGGFGSMGRAPAAEGMIDCGSSAVRD